MAGGKGQVAAVSCYYPTKMALNARKRGEERPRRCLAILLAGAMGVVAGAFLLKPLNDPDFFWHLKTGEWIWQHGQLPNDDPFAPAGSPALGPAHRFTLTAYWVSQVLYYLVHAAAGMRGILFLKAVTITMYVLALLRLRRGDPIVHTALVLASLPLLLNYPFDRPQAFSFVFFVLLLSQLERERTSAAVPVGWKSYLAIPLLMLLWANMHGGYVVGQVTLLLFLALEGAKFAHPSLRPLGRDRYRRMLMLGVIGLGASLLSPSSSQIGAGMALVPSPEVAAYNLEYVSTVDFFRGQPLAVSLCVIVGLAVISAAVSAGKTDVTWLALLAGTGYEAYLHVRYLPFFIGAALPAIGSMLSSPRWGQRTRPILVAGALALAALGAKGELPTPERLALASRVNENFYPVGAADFIVANAPLGNLYNTYTWGGYLLWRLAPARPVFIDGRGLDPRALQESFAISGAYARPGESVPEWKRLLRERHIGFMVIPRRKYSQGMRFDGAAPLRAALVRAPEWVLVYADDISLVYALSIPGHFDLFRRHEIPRGTLPG